MEFLRVFLAAESYKICFLVLKYKDYQVLDYGHLISRL